MGRSAACCLLAALLLTGGWPSTAVLAADAELLPATVETIRRRIQRTATPLKDPEALHGALDAAVILWAEQAFIGMDNVYSGQGTRYLTLRLSIANATGKDLELPRSGITLLAGGKPIGIGSTPQEYPLQIDRGLRPQSRLKTPPSIALPSGKGATFWCVFAGLPMTPELPQLLLNCEFASGETAQSDLNAQMEARLGLLQQRLGPREALTVFTVTGQLNTLNARVLAREMSRLNEQGCERFLVEWAPRALPSDDLALSWLLYSTTSRGRDNPLHLQLPTLPPVRQMRLSQLPRENRSFREEHDAEKQVFLRSSEAAADLLAEIYQLLDRGQSLRELREGHPWSQAAALRHAGDRLGPEALPLILKLLNTTDSDLRRAAIIALGAQRDPDAEERLKKIATGNSSGDAEAALLGLLRAEQEPARALARTLLESQGAPIAPERLVGLLSEFYHPDWNDALRKLAAESDVAGRRAAILALHRLGHPELPQLCIQALADPAAGVRETAFGVLVSRSEPECERAALQYALDRLRDGRFDDSVLSFIERACESRAAPLLLSQLDSAGPLRLRLIQVLGIVGGSGHIESLMARLPTFSGMEQAAALQLSDRLSPASQVAAARVAIRSPDPAVFQAGLEILKTVRSRDGLELLGALLDTARKDRLPQIAMALGEIGSPEAIERLKAFREEAAKTGREDALAAARAGLHNWQSRLPGWNYVESGLYYSQQEDYKTAENWYALAIEINPELSIAYSSRANMLLRQDKFPQAGVDFRKAFELDPYDSQAVTGVAIILAIDGEWEEALEFVNSRAHQHPGDSLYYYNAACVYGRAVEFLQKQPANAERDRNLERLRAGGVERLREAVRLGFDQFDWMDLDPDLETLRRLPEFRALIPAVENHDP